MRARRRQSGVTLLEVLVVMIIAGMASAIVFQGFGQILKIDRFFQAESDFMRDQAMYRSWWRSSVESLQPDYADGPNRFKGGERQFRGLSTSSLGQFYGAVQPVEWALDFDAQEGEIRLVYRDSKESHAIHAWRGSVGRFVYYGIDGQRYSSWPPEMGLHPQVPAAIAIQAGFEGNLEFWMATPFGPLFPPVRIQDVLPGLGMPGAR